MKTYKIVCKFDLINKEFGISGFNIEGQDMQHALDEFFAATSRNIFVRDLDGDLINLNSVIKIEIVTVEEF